MGKRLIKDSTLSGIADAIRAKDGNNSPMTPLEMPGRIAGIPVGGGGVELPELSKPAGSSEILKGYQAVNGVGALVEGTHVCAGLDELTADGTAIAENILMDRVAYVKGERIVGAMGLHEDPEERTLNCGDEFYVIGGYHTGGNIKVNSLANQTKATAGAGDIASGKTAWVNGAKVTGTAVKSDYSIEVLGEVEIPNGSTPKTFEAPEGWTHLIFEDKIGQKAFFPKPNGYQGDYYMTAYSGDSSGTTQTVRLTVNMSGKEVITAGSYYIKSITAVKVVGL